MRKEKHFLEQINFFDSNGVNLYKMGGNYYASGRRETFYIAANERLIGCELDHGARYVLGITFIKCTIDA